MYLGLNLDLRLCGTLWSRILNGSCLGGRIILSLLFGGRGDSSYEVEQCDKTQSCRWPGAMESRILKLGSIVLVVMEIWGVNGGFHHCGEKSLLETMMRMRGIGFPVKFGCGFLFLSRDCVPFWVDAWLSVEPLFM